MDKFDTPVTPARCRVFFDKVVDVPVVLCNGVPKVQSMSLSVAYERHVTSMTHRIACLRAVHVTALPYFTRLPVSCLSQQTREQARAVAEFLCPSSGFLPFPLFTGVWLFSKFLGSAFPSAFAGESGTFHIQRVQGAPGPVPRKVLNLPVVLRRRYTYSVTIQKTVEFPQIQFLDCLMTSVVVQRLVLGRYSADNCGGAAVAWGPRGNSAGAVLGQV